MPKALEKFLNQKMGKLEKIESMELMSIKSGLKRFNKWFRFCCRCNADLLKAINVMPYINLKTLLMNKYDLVIFDLDGVLINLKKI